MDLDDKGIKRILARTPADIQQTRKKDCRYCMYMAGTKLTGDLSNSYCNYIGITEHSRPCFPGECRSAGVFISKASLAKSGNTMPHSTDTLLSEDLYTADEI